MKKAALFGGILLALLIILVGFGYWQTQQTSGETISLDEARVKAVTFINENLMQPGSQVSVKEATDEGDLYKIVVNLSNGQEVESYLTKDGKTFFPQAMDIEEIENANQAQDNNTPEAAPANVPKSGKPSIELFVMSHCPYGTQIEKGILPVLNELGDSVDFELKFCDYAMHGEKELTEQMNQYCIQKEYPEKLTSYLDCFLEDETKSAACMQSNGISSAAISSCVTETDEQYKITENFENNVDYRGQFPGFAIYKADTDKYGVSGSPTLVINGQKVSSGRSPAALMATICSGFENEPEACQTSLSTATPAPGFGGGTASNASAAECGG